jgi:type VI secretion system Hcp family effector
MPLSPIAIFYGPNGKIIPGPEKVPGTKETGCFLLEFTHNVYTILKDSYYSTLYGIDVVRKHDPMVFVKNIDNMSVNFVEYMNKESFLKKIEIRWYQYNTEKSGIKEYFRMTLEDIQFNKISHHMPNIKDPKYERYDTLESIAFMFRKITWLYLKGYLTYTDIWNESFGELYDDDFFDGEDLIEMVIEKLLKMKFTSGSFNNKCFLDFDKKAKIDFTYLSNRKLNRKENKVFAKLFAKCKGKTEDLYQINEGRIVSEDKWSTDFKLTKPSNYEEGDTVEYFAVIENGNAENNNFKSSSITLPAKPKGFIHINCSFFGTSEMFEEGITCVIKDEEGNEYSSTIDKKGNVLWEDIPLGIYKVYIKYNNELYISSVRWYRSK